MRNKVEIPENQEVFKLIEVCRLARIQPNMLRFWGTEFDQMETQENDNGEFFYTRRQVELVLKIQHLLVNERMSIVNARKRIGPKGETTACLEIYPKPARQKRTPAVRETRTESQRLPMTSNRAVQEDEIARAVAQRLEPLMSALTKSHPDIAKTTNRT